MKWIASFFLSLWRHLVGFPYPRPCPVPVPVPPADRVALQAFVLGAGLRCTIPVELSLEVDQAIRDTVVAELLYHRTARGVA